MRTTLTLDKDVAAMLERLRKTRGGKLKNLVNEALRQGLKQTAAPPRRRKDFRTDFVDLGTCRFGSVDNVSEILAVVEGEAGK